MMQSFWIYACMRVFLILWCHLWLICCVYLIDEVETCRWISLNELWYSIISNIWGKAFYYQISDHVTTMSLYTLNWCKVHSFPKQCLYNLHFVKTTSLSPNLSKLAPADIIWRTLFSKNEKKHCLKNEWILGMLKLFCEYV